MKKSRYRKSDNQHSENGRERQTGKGCLPGIRYFRCYLLQLESKIRWNGSFGHQTNEGFGRRKPAPETDVCQPQFRAHDSKRHYRKKALKPAEKRELVDYVIAFHQASLRTACKVVGLSRSTYKYEPDLTRDQVVIEALQRLAEDYPSYGFQMMFDKLRQEGLAWNHKRVYRIYRSLNLNLRRKGKKRLPSRNPEKLAEPDTLNQTWSADFMSDSLMTGRRFRTFNVVDDFNRELLGIAIDLNIPSICESFENWIKFLR